MFNKRAWPKKTVLLAKKMRKEGSSYDEIRQQLGVSKSTLHYWLNHLLPREQVREIRRKLGKTMQPAGARASHERRLQRLEDIKLSVAQQLKIVDLNSMDLKRLLLSMLYWAEGAKKGSSLTFANTDPLLCSLFIKLLREVYAIEEKKVRIRVHLHDYHDVEKTFSYWSQLLNVPLSQFGKPYIKPRSKIKKFRENFAGICFIRYYSTNLKEEILQTGYQLADKICSVKLP